MGFVDDDQSQFGVGQEQGGTRTDDHLGVALGQRPPVFLAFRLFHSAVPGERLSPEPRMEPVEKWLGQRDFGQQHQHLLVLTQGFGDRFKIDLGLARAGYTVEQKGFELRCSDRLDQYIADPLLILAEINRVEIGQGLGTGGKRGNVFPVKHAQLFQPPDHCDRYTGLIGQFADRPLHADQFFERLFALRR